MNRGKSVNSTAETNLMTKTIGNTTKARIFHEDGRIEEYDNQPQAYRLYLGLPKGFRAAFRGKRDARPVQPHDYVTR